MDSLADGSRAVEIRRATPGDRPAILDLARVSLGWRDDPTHGRFFDWKHLESPFGPSPMWVGVAGEQIVGLRTFMRWEFADPADPGGRRFQAVRAVDTATHPDFQGRGLFTRLTLHALDELQAEGVDFVFNTPNAASRPGYLKMGWHQVGRLPIAVLPRGFGSGPRLLQARAPAEKWSVPTTAGVPAGEVFAPEGDTVARLLRSMPPPDAMATVWTPERLAWRFAFPELHYRFGPAGGAGFDPDDGGIVFRLRRRGPAVELMVARIMMPGARARSVRPLVRRLLGETGADYALVLGADRIPGAMVPAPRSGPILTHRPVADPRPVTRWSLTMADVELL